LCLGVASDYFIDLFQALSQQQDAVGHFTKAVEVKRNALFGIFEISNEISTQLDGRLAAALANLGHVLDDMGLYDEAVSHFKRAVDVDGSQASWYKKLGISLVHLEKVSE
jgi:tetratricopeptide (TPR) repeat protein